MKKVILTEGQLKLVKLIKENTQFSDRVTELINNIKTDVNKMYSLLIYTTIAEIRDGDIDISKTAQKFEVLEDKKDGLDRKVSDFEQRYMNRDGDWPNQQLEKIHTDLDMKLYNLSPKLSALGLIIDALTPLSKIDEYGEKRGVDMHTPFNDIKPTEI